MRQNRVYITRLHKYRNTLFRFKALGLVRVFSDNLADAVGATSSQVRKDFSLFGISGNKRGGYLVDDLIKRLDELLGKDKEQKVIVVGAGKIGTALMNYKVFEKEGIRIVAAFDTDPAKFCQSREDVSVLPLENLPVFVKDHDIKIGIIAVPDFAAQQILNLIVAAGIRGVLNFAPIRLKTAEECVINNVNLGLELETIIYYVNTLGKGIPDANSDI
jgi:redox-sensing transcriptional repressor